VYGENSEAPRTHDAEQVLIRNIGLRSAVSAFMAVWGRCGTADIQRFAKGYLGGTRQSVLFQHPKKGPPLVAVCAAHEASASAHR
jgi:hypothetical protein